MESRESRLWAPGFRWAYLLAAVPLLTDLAETGRFPGSPREWISELVAGLLIAALVARVRAEHLQVLALARTDPLTGLWNRRSFEAAIASECARAERLQQPLALVCLDLDRFKQVNDLAGHDEGDRVLKLLAAALGQTLRANVDQGFRLGGDEFAMLLPGSTAEQAQRVVTRVRESCFHSDPVWTQRSLDISAGVVEFAPGEGADSFLRRADAAMYEHKRRR
jgi:diguanylate cyclase (GGDEF)-like protein